MNNNEDSVMEEESFEDDSAEKKKTLEEDTTQEISESDKIQTLKGISNLIDDSSYKKHLEVIENKLNLIFFSIVEPLFSVPTPKNFLSLYVLFY